MDYQDFLDILEDEFDLDWSHDLQMVIRGKHYDETQAEATVLRIATNMEAEAKRLMRLVEDKRRADRYRIYAHWNL